MRDGRHGYGADADGDDVDFKMYQYRNLHVCLRCYFGIESRAELRRDRFVWAIGSRRKDNFGGWAFDSAPRLAKRLNDEPLTKIPAPARTLHADRPTGASFASSEHGAKNMHARRRRHHHHPCDGVVEQRA
jgi:hypothetical protein